MESDGAGAKKRGGRAIIVVLAIIMVSATAVVGYALLAPEKTVSGFVRDANGSPIQGATVSALGTSVTTVADGSYTLKVETWSKFVVQAEAEGHWTQKQWAGESGEPLIFSLIGDQEYWVVVAIAYIHFLSDTNLETLTSVQTEWRTYLYIDDYAEGDEKALRPSTVSGNSASERYNASSYGVLAKVMVSGVYWDEPGACENCYATIEGEQEFWTEDHADYMNIEDVPADQPFNTFNYTSEPQEGIGIVSNTGHDFMLPSELGVRVNVTILGKGFQTILPVSYLATTSESYHVQVNVDAAQPDQIFRIYSYRDGGWIIHIWEMPVE